MPETELPENHDVRTLIIVIVSLAVYTLISAALAFILSDMVLPVMAGLADLIMAVTIIIGAARRKLREREAEAIRRAQKMIKLQQAT